MSLWTPDGEHNVPREPATGPSGAGPAPEQAPHDHADHDHGDDDFGDDDFDAEAAYAAMSPEDRARAEAMAAEMEEVRRQLASVPAAVVVANHAMGLYELAAIHLSADPPSFREAQLAIDALGALVEGLQGRLGENEPTLRDALVQLQMAYVQVKGAHG